MLPNCPIYIKILIRILSFGIVMDEKWSFSYERFLLFMQKIRPRQANDQGNVIIVH